MPLERNHDSNSEAHLGLQERRRNGVCARFLTRTNRGAAPPTAALRLSGANRPGEGKALRLPPVATRIFAACLPRGGAWGDRRRARLDHDGRSHLDPTVEIGDVFVGETHHPTTISVPIVDGWLVP